MWLPHRSERMEAAMTTALEAFHMAMDLVLAATCGIALFQWRWWMLRAARAERAALDAWNVTRHFHTKLQNGLVPPSQRPTWKGEAS